MRTVLSKLWFRIALGLAVVGFRRVTALPESCVQA